MPSETTNPQPQTAPNIAPKNLIIFLSDQERAIQHFPPDWEARNLPGITRLKKNGITFEYACANACMCSPSRSTLMTGYFPAQHGVKYTLEENMPDDQYPQVELPLNLPNLATTLSAAGYNVVYKGKWHCSKPAGSTWEPSDVAQYGFARWDPPDAGANQDISQAGGGTTNNDGRYMNDNGDWESGDEGALPYLNAVAATQQPFALIISLVNPHDVLFYPNTYTSAGYDDSWLVGDIQVPETDSENLSTKPTVQQQFQLLSQGLGRLTDDQMKRNYLNFYGNLMKSTDNYLVQVLDALDTLGLTDNTLVIRTADHGEMGLTHGGVRQKNFNMYEETLRIPLVFSNPTLYKTAYTSRALVSHVDLLPTLASFLNVPDAARAAWQGVDYSSILLDPQAQGVQDYTVFTYDDWQSGQPNPPYPKPPNHIISFREERYKFGEYYDTSGQQPTQWEMYDMLTDPLETKNLAYEGYARTPEEQTEYERLSAKLEEIKATRLQPLPS